MKEPAAPTKDGYIFAGWYADSAYTKAFDFKNTKITSDTKIYAKFVSEDEKFTVSFNSNGGSSVASQTVNAGEKVTKPSDPTKANFIFAGWYCDAALTEAYDFNTPVLSNITLYAKWTAESGTFTVTFNSNGGSAVPSQTVKAGEKAVKPANPTKSGCTFSGWYSDSALTTQYNFNSAVTANITLYAKWTTSSGGGGYVPPSTYSITYDGNGNTAGTAPSDSKSYQSGTEVTVLAADSTFVRDNKVLSGWNTKADGTGTPYQAGDVFIITANTTLYAQWSDMGNISISGDDNTATITSAPDNSTGSVLFNLNNYEDINTVKLNSSVISSLSSSDDVTDVVIEINNTKITIPKNKLGTNALSVSVITDNSGISDEDKKVYSLNGIIYKISIKNETTPSPNALILLNNDASNTSKISIVLPASKITDAVFSVNNLHTLTHMTSYDADASEFNGLTISVDSASDVSYIVADKANTIITKTVIDANTWLSDAGMGTMFKFVQGENLKEISLEIDVNALWPSDGNLPNFESSKLSNFLSNMGTFFKSNFSELGVNSIKAGTSILYGVGTDDTTAGFNKDGLMNLVLNDLICGTNGIFADIAELNNNGVLRDISIEMSGNSTITKTTFDAKIVMKDSSENGAGLTKIKNFAGTLSKHIEMKSESGQVTITITAPETLLQTALEKVQSNNPTATYNDLKSKFDDWKVDQLLSTIAGLKVDEAVPGGKPGEPTSATALNKAAGFIYDNGALIDKLIDYIQISVSDTSDNGTPISLFDSTKEFKYEGSTGDPLTNWEKCVNALSNVLTEGAKNATPGTYWNASDKTYHLDASISVNLSHFYNAAIGSGANDNSFVLETSNVKIILDIFGDHKSDLASPTTPEA